MGGKKGGKSSGFVSAGLNRNVSRQITKQMRRDYVNSGRRMVNQREAWLKGKNVVLTIENPKKDETNRPFIRVNARDVWGSPKYNL